MDVGPCLDQYQKAIYAYHQTDDHRGLCRVLIEENRAYLTLAAIPIGSLPSTEALETTLETLEEKDTQLRGSILIALTQSYWHALQMEKAEGLAWQAFEIGQCLPDYRLCAQASHGLALVYALQLRMHEAQEHWQAALFYARQTQDLLLQCWSLARLPGVLISLGNLAEAEATAQEAGALISELQDWGNYSLTVAYLAHIALGRGDFAAIERYGAEAVRMMQRSHYPWGGLIIFPTFFRANLVQEAWAEAGQVLDNLLEPGRVFAEVGPTIHVLVWLYRLLLRAYTGALEEVKAQLAADPFDILETYTFGLHPLECYCTLAEISCLTHTPLIAEPVYNRLLAAREQGIVFSTGSAFLLPRLLGNMATLKRSWETAEAHFQDAIEVAHEAGARLELGQSYQDYAMMLKKRNTGTDQQYAEELLYEAGSVFEELGIAPLEREKAA